MYLNFVNFAFLSAKAPHQIYVRSISPFISRQGRHSSAKDLPCYGENSPAEIDHNVRAILLDTRGPEIRTGKLANDHSGHETVVFEAGGLVTPSHGS